MRDGLKHLVLLLFWLVSGCFAEPFAIDVFRAGEGGYHTFRIPGLVATPKGTLLAYAEARKGSRSDWAAIDLVVKRSTDAGRTWSALRVVGKIDEPVRKNPVAVEKKLAVEGEATYNNPTAVVTRRGKIVLLYCLEYMRAFVTESVDDGLTFGAPREITESFAGFRGEYAWRVLAIGPGHGIELREGPWRGRLLAPVWLSTGEGGNGHSPSVAATIYSDDGGATWKGGAIGLRNTAEFGNPSESALAELPGGRVLWNVRNTGARRRRLQLTSATGVDGWSAPRFVEELNEPVCFGSLLSLGGRGKGKVLFVNPDSQKERRNLTLRTSRDGGATWGEARVLDAGAAGYADLARGTGARGRRGKVYVLYEAGAPIAALRLLEVEGR